MFGIRNQEGTFRRGASWSGKSKYTDYQERVHSKEKLLGLIESSVSQNRTSAARRLERWISRQPANGFCADCGESNPEWVNTTFGTIICIKCAGAHRGLRIRTVVKNVRLDNWTETLVDVVIARGGNRTVNRKLEGHLPSWRKPSRDCGSDVRRRFAADKYEQALFADLDQAQALDMENDQICRLVRFLGKFAKHDAKMEYYGGCDAVTDTLSVLVEDALVKSESFRECFSELFIRMGFSMAKGTFSRSLDESDMKDLNRVLTDRGSFMGTAVLKQRRRRQTTFQEPQQQSCYQSSPRRSNRQAQQERRRTPSPPMRGRSPSPPSSRDNCRDHCSPMNSPKHREERNSPMDPQPIPFSRNSRWIMEEEKETDQGNDTYYVKIYAADLNIGVGQHRWGGAEITWVKPGSESWICGIRRGDLLLEVNTVDVQDSPIPHIIDLLEEGRPVSMRLRRTKK